MNIPTLHGLIARRILVNYRVDAEVLARWLPEPFRPQTVNGAGIAGICLIRLEQIRPAFVPRILGLSSENAAHRVAVEWDEAGQRRHGVYIPRRDTSSRLNTFVGGRLFPGVHHHARFHVVETPQRIELTLRSDEGDVGVSLAANVAADLPAGSAFRSLADASAFFEAGSVGYSATASAGRFDGMELRCRNWQVRPLDVEHVESSFFADERTFPKGTTEFDCALLMRHVDHQWHGLPALCR